MHSKRETPCSADSVDPSSVLVVIPARDEEDTIGNVVSELAALGFDCIRVVDNGSCDRTAVRAVAAGAVVIAEPVAGYGRACWTGCQNIPEGRHWILFCDADGSDCLEELDGFLDAGAEADLVLGNRMAYVSGRRQMTTAQKFGNRLATALLFLGWGFRFRDLGPLRMVRRSIFGAIDMRDRGFGWTLEMQVRAVELRARIVELPVSYRPRQGGRSKISGSLVGSYQAGRVILSTVFKLWCRKVFPGRR